MGLFKNKSSKSVNSDIAAKSNRTSNSSLKSPGLNKAANGSSFTSLPSLPDTTLPAPPDPTLDPAAYLRSINSVRDRTKLVYQRAKRNQLAHFDVDSSKFRDTADYVVSIIKVGSETIPRSVQILTGSQRDYAPDYTQIPVHGRWQHFEAGGRPRIDQLVLTWPSTVDKQERTRRLLDLFLVSVLLDAGAGQRWSYKSKESGKLYRRSEGLAVASIEMFKQGFFSSDASNPSQVDAAGLKRLNPEQLARGLQISESNPMAGFEGRAGLLSRLSDALRNPKYFGNAGRPGHMLGMVSHRL